MTAVERLIATARAEIGYVEKKSNSQLDDKTANAGSNNWNKYARDLDALGVVYNGKKNGYAWCDIFVDWCFIHTFGLETGVALLCQEKNGCGAGCTYSARYYKQKGRFHTTDPKPGDQIFFSDDGGKTSYHTGLVVDVRGGKVYTIEGNTSSTPGVVANGGMVRDKSYSLSYAKIVGYGRPDYSIIKEEPEMSNIDETRQKLTSCANTGDNPSGWSKEATEYCKRKGIFNGDGAGNYGWQQPITREAVAQVIYNVLDSAGMLDKLPDAE